MLHAVARVGVSPHREPVDAGHDDRHRRAGPVGGPVVVEQVHALSDAVHVVRHHPGVVGRRGASGVLDEEHHPVDFPGGLHQHAGRGPGIGVARLGGGLLGIADRGGVGVRHL